MADIGNKETIQIKANRSHGGCIAKLMGEWPHERVLSAEPGDCGCREVSENFKDIEFYIYGH
jgi:uncharacterized Fe-S cluster-containing protein